jgi:hypothetical protein
MLDRGDECGEPRTCIVIEIECEAVFVNHARLRAAARKKLSSCRHERHARCR